MNLTLLKALVVLVPGVMLLTGSVALFRRHKTTDALLQVLGAGSLVVVVLTHLLEALHAFPSMGWGRRTASVITSICAVLFSRPRYSPQATCFMRSGNGFDRLVRFPFRGSDGSQLV